MYDALRRAKNALRIFAPRACTVASTERIGSHLQRVRFQGDALKGLAPILPGQQLSVLVTGMWPAGGRNYSISAASPDARWVEVIAHLHGNGDGARRFAGFRVGDEAQLWGPGGGFVFPDDGRAKIYLGDESTVGTFLSVLAHEPTSQAFCAVEDDRTAHALQALHPRLHGVTRKQRVVPNEPEDDDTLTRDDVLFAIAERHIHTNPRFILAGRTRSLHRLRAQLLHEGVPSHAISIRAFWDDR